MLTVDEAKKIAIEKILPKYRKDFRDEHYELVALFELTQQREDPSESWSSPPRAYYIAVFEGLCDRHLPFQVFHAGPKENPYDSDKMIAYPTIDKSNGENDWYTAKIKSYGLADKSPLVLGNHESMIIHSAFCRSRSFHRVWTIPDEERKHLEERPHSPVPMSPKALKLQDSVYKRVKALFIEREKVEISEETKDPYNISDELEAWRKRYDPYTALDKMVPLLWIKGLYIDDYLGHDLVEYFSGVDDESAEETVRRIDTYLWCLPAKELRDSVDPYDQALEILRKHGDTEAVEDLNDLERCDGRDLELALNYIWNRGRLIDKKFAQLCGYEFYINSFTDADEDLEVAEMIREYYESLNGEPQQTGL